MTQTIQASLKASKQVAHAPSKAEVVLTDGQKLSTAPLIEQGALAFQFGIDYANAKVLKDKQEADFSGSVVAYIKGNSLDYQSMIAVKKHIAKAIALSKGNTEKYVYEWLNKIIKAYTDTADLQGWSMPKAESKSAKSMSKARAELASKTDDQLKAEIDKAKSSTDLKALTAVAKYAKELATRKAKAEKALEKASADNLKGLRKQLIDWLKPMSADDLAVMLYVKHNFDAISKQAKITK